VPGGEEKLNSPGKFFNTSVLDRPESGKQKIAREKLPGHYYPPE
jgi:hypothetical protein